MKYEITFFLYMFTSFGVVVCSITKEGQPNKYGLPRTKILESIYDVSGSSKEFTSNTNSEDVSEVCNDDLHDHLLKKFVTKLSGVDKDVYGDKKKEIMDQDNGLRMLSSRNLYPKLYAVRPLPSVDNLPPVYISRPRGKYMYHEEEPLNYNPELLDSLNPILIPVNLNKPRTTSEEDFWAHLSEDAILKNIIPTMEVPMPRHPYTKYNQLFRTPIHLRPSEYMSNNPDELYSERDFSNYT